MSRKKKRAKKQRPDILFRKSHKGKDIKIYLKPYDFDDDIVNSTTKDYVVWADGAVVLKTDSLKNAEDEYTKQCQKYYDDVHGRFAVGRHALVGGVVKTLGEEI